MSFIEEVLDNFQEVTNKTECFLGDKDASTQIESLLKSTYDYIKQQESDSFKTNALPELIIDNFDVEQIWQQLELQNEALLTHSLGNVSKLLVGKKKLIFDELQNIDLEEKPSNQEPAENASDESSSDDEDDNRPLNLEEGSDENALNSDDLTDNDEAEREQRPRKKIKPSIVDDKFFKLNEMEAFLQAEEKKIADEDPDSGNDSEELDEEDEEDEEDIDLFNSNDLFERNDTERGGINNPKYKDFFVEQDGVDESSTKASKRNKFLEEVENLEKDEQERESDADQYEDEAAPLEMKSTLEEREDRLKCKMAALEEAAVSDKPWQLRGEITADNRPQNSLLEEVVEFDMTTRPAPVITEATSLQLEDIIRQRIKDKAFDSVERKQKPVETPFEYKKKLVLDQEKNKESLAQIYEKEYLQQQEALDPDSADKEQEEPPLHIEIKKMMFGLFSKLDALSNFHFTPKQIQPELKVISNLPAVSMEEVAPVATSDAALLAPEEVKGKVRGDIIGQSERTATDKKRERRKKKNKQHEHALLKQKTEMLALGNKHSKEKAQKMLEQVTKSKNIDKMDESVGSKSVASSTAFFTQLEEEIKTQVKNKNSVKKKQSKQIFDAKKLKL